MTFGFRILLPVVIKAIHKHCLRPADTHSSCKLLQHFPGEACEALWQNSSQQMSQSTKISKNPRKHLNRHLNLLCPPTSPIILNFYYCKPVTQLVTMRYNGLWDTKHYKEHVISLLAITLTHPYSYYSQYSVYIGHKSLCHSATVQKDTAARQNRKLAHCKEHCCIPALTRNPEGLLKALVETMKVKQWKKWMNMEVNGCGI